MEIENLTAILSMLADQIGSEIGIYRLGLAIHGLKELKDMEPTLEKFIQSIIDTAEQKLAKNLADKWGI